MDKKRGRPKTIRENSPPPASRTRSKSPARTTSSGRDSAPLKRASRAKKNETPSEEVSSSSQSSTPKKQLRAKKEKPIVVDDSEDNEEVAKINANEARRRSNRILGQQKATPTPSENAKRSVSRAASSLTKEDSDDEESKPDIGIYSKAWSHIIILILLVTLPIILHIVAAAGGWKWDKIVSAIKNPETYLNVTVVLIAAGIHLLISLISMSPVGRIVSISERTYKFNGIVSAAVVLSIIVGLELKNGTTISLFFTNLDRFLNFAIFTAIQASTVSFLLSKHKPSSIENAYGQTGRFVIDFVAGRELNPAAFKMVDMKRVLNNESIIWILIINVTLLFKNISIPTIESASEGSPIGELIKRTYNNFIFILHNSEYNTAALVVSGLIVVYALDALINEHHLATSFLVNDEGCGAEFLLRSASFPYLISLLPRFLLLNNVKVCNAGLTVAGLFFLLGLVIKRCSNCLKYEYRLKPSDPKFKDLTTLPTFQNQRLIISRWFSKIRQPNLLGEIIIHLSLLYLLAFTFDIATCIGIIAIIVYLVYRSIGINRKNAIKYESSWKRYVAAVKYNLLPRVY